MVYLWCPRCETTTEHDNFGVIGVKAKGVVFRCTECLRYSRYLLQEDEEQPDEKVKK